MDKRLKALKRHENTTYHFTYPRTMFLIPVTAHYTLSEICMDGEGNLVLYLTQNKGNNREITYHLHRLVQYFGFSSFYVRLNEMMYRYREGKVQHMFFSSLVSGDLVSTQPLQAPISGLFHKDCVVGTRFILTKNRRGITN